MNLPQFRTGHALVIPVILTVNSPPTLYDPPTPPVISIQDPNGTVQLTNAPMTRSSTGFYNYTYVLVGNAVLGDWLAWVDATDGIFLSGTVKVYVFSVRS